MLMSFRFTSLRDYLRYLSRHRRATVPQFEGHHRDLSPLVLVKVVLLDAVQEVAFVHAPEDVEETVNLDETEPAPITVKVTADQ